MKCSKCNYEGFKREFRYLFSGAAAATNSFRSCPKCGEWNECDELGEEMRDKEVLAQQEKD